MTPAQSVASKIAGWASDPGPLYQSLSDALERSVARGELAADELLPTERELAGQLAVSRTTVAAAYRQLKDRGVLESRQGRGTWIARGPESVVPAKEPEFSPEIFAGMIEPLHDTIDLAPACPPAGTVVTDALKDIAGEQMIEAVDGHGYIPGGYPPLVERVAQMLSSLGLPTRPDQILITNGAQQAIALLGRLFHTDGRPAAVESVTYPGYPTLGHERIGVEMDSHGMVPSALEEVLQTARPAFVYTIPTFQNPTGRVMTPGRREEIAALCARYGTPLVEDEVMRWLPLDDRTPPPSIATLAPKAPVITVGSLNKVLWGGLRVGWARAEPGTIARLAQLKTLADVGSPVFGQWIAARMIERVDEAAVEKQEMLRSRYAVMSDALARDLPDWSWEPPRGGPCLLARLPDTDAQIYAQVAGRFGVHLLPGPVMSPDGGNRDAIRVPFTHDGPTLRAAVARMAAAWKAYHGQERPTQTVPQPMVCV